MADKARLSKEEVKREPAFNVWLRSLQHHIQGYSGNLLKVSIGVVSVAVIFGGIYALYTYNRNQAQTVFSQALEIYNGEVKDPKEPASAKNSGKKTYADEKQKCTEAIPVFEKASGYSSEREVSRYYLALCRMKLDAVQGQKEMRTLAEGTGQVSQLARVALADSLFGTGQVDEVVVLYKQLQDIWQKNNGVGVVVPVETIQFNLGRAYEAQGKIEEATQAYSEVVRLDPKSASAVAAAARVEAINPEAARKLPTKSTDQDAI